VVWTGYILTGPDTGAYTFTANTDDGVRVWVGNPMTAGGEVINSWQDQAPTNRSGVVNLNANTFYAIRYEYYQNGGGTAAQLSWMSATVATQVIPAANYYTPGNASVVQPPTGLTATAGYNQAVLNWTAGANATNYTVLRGTVNGGPYAPIATGIAGTTYTDSTITFPNTYYYVVVGYDAVGNSPYSNQATCAPLQPPITVNPNALQVVENGGTQPFTVTLLFNPTANVTVGVTSGNAAELLLTGPGGGAPAGTVTLTFVPGGALSQQVTVTGVQRFVEGAPVVVPISFTVTSTDANYPAASAPPNISCTIISDAPGIVLNPPTGLSTVNGGPAVQFTVQLATIPTATVTLNLSVDNPTLATVAPPQIVIPAGTNPTPVTVTVTPLNVNTATTYMAPYNIVINPSTSLDPLYAALPDAFEPISTPVNIPPLNHVWKCGLVGGEVILALGVFGLGRRIWKRTARKA